MPSPGTMPSPLRRGWRRPELRGLVGLVAVSALALLAIAPARDAPGAPGRSLTVLVYASPESLSQLRLLGVRIDQLGATVRTDLRRALGATIAVSVAGTTADFAARAEAAAREVARKHGVLEEAARVARERKQLLQRGLVTSSELQAAEAALARASAAADRELARRQNIAGVACGSLGIELAGGPVFGGRTHSGERWAIVYTGALALVFPAPGDLRGGRQTGLDFSVPAFDRFRPGYSAGRRKVLAARALANAVVEQIGRLLGLKPTSGPLADAMRGTLDLQEAEHFARGTAPVRFDGAQRRALVRSASSEVAKCG